MEGLMTRPDEVVVELLDPRLVADRWVRVRPRRGRLRRVLAALPVHEVEALGLRVVGLEVFVRERPGGGDSAVVVDLAEVPLTQPEEDGAVDLRLAPDVVVLTGVERLPVLVEPRLVRLVLVADEYRAAVPVVRLAPQVIAALEDEDALAGGRQPVRERAAPGAGPDDDHVVVLGHEFLLRRERWARSRRRWRRAASER